MKLQNGFTLVELMITVVIVAIIASVALPSYTEYVMRGKIPDATANLSTKRVQLEQFFLDNRTYVGAPACTNDATSSKYFTFSCSTQTATTYTVQAAGSGSMAGFTYTIDQNNAKATTAAPSGWSTNATCWMTSKTGC